MKSYTQYIRRAKRFAAPRRARIGSAVEDAAMNEELIEEEIIDMPDDSVFAEEADAQDSAEWEIVGVDVSETVDESRVEELQEELGTDPLSEEINEGETLIDEADNHIEALNNLKTVAVEKWEEHGDVSDEIAAIDPGLESRIRRIPRHRRDLRACLEAIDAQIDEVTAGKAVVEAVVVDKLIEQIEDKYEDIDDVGEEVADTIKEAQEERMESDLAPDDTVTKEDVESVPVFEEEGNGVEVPPRSELTVREVSESFVEQRSIQVPSRVIAACVNNEDLVVSAVVSLREAHEMFTNQRDDLNIFFEGFEQILGDTFTGDWETFRTVPFMNEFSERVREVTAKMEQFPPVSAPISSIEKIERVGEYIAQVLQDDLQVDAKAMTSALEEISKRLDGVPDRLSQLEGDGINRGEHMTSLLKEYITNVRVLTQYVDEFRTAGEVVISLVSGHDEMLGDLSDAVESRRRW